MSEPTSDRVLHDPSGVVTITFSYPDPDSVHYVAVDVNGKQLDAKDTSRADGDNLLTQYVSMGWIEDNPPAAEGGAGAHADQPAAASKRPTGTGPGF